MRKITILLILLFFGIQEMNAQNYFLKEIQNNPAEDVKYGYKFRIKNYLDSLEKIDDNKQVFENDSAKQQHYRGIISNIDLNIKHNPDNAENYVYKGMYKSLLYEYDSAKLLLDKAIEINPNYAEAYLERGVLNITRLETKKGISDFKKALKINPEYTDAIYNLGYVYFQQGNYKQAKTYFEEAISKFKYHYQSYIQLAYIYLIEQDYERSNQNYSMAIEINPFEPLAYNLRGQMYLYQGNIEKAKLDLEKSLTLDPSNYSIIFMLAYIEMELGNLEHGIELISSGTKILNKFTYADKISDYSEAEMNDILVNYEKYAQAYSDETKEKLNTCLRNILQNKELYNTIFLLKGILENDAGLILPKRLLLYNQVKTGNIFTIEKEIDELLELDSSLAYVHVLKGEILQEKYKFNESVSCYTMAIKLKPDYSYAYSARAWANYKQGKIEPAYEDVEIALKDVPPYLAAINVKAVLLDALYKPNESIELYSLAINYFPNYPFLYTNRALTFLKIHDYEKALEDCNLAIDIAPNYYLPYTTRGNIYLSQDENFKAIKDFNKALELSPFDLNTVLSKSRAYQESGNPEKSEEMFKDLIEKGVDTKYWYHALAEVYNTMEKYELAIENLTKAILLDNTFLDAYITRARSKSSIDDIDGAIKDLDYVLNIDIANIGALFEKAMIYSRNGEYEKSNQEYLKIIDINTNTSFSAYGNIGWNYYLEGKYEECINWSEKAVEIDSEAFFAMYNIALSYLCLGEYEKSIELYNEYYNLDKDINNEVHDGAIKDLKDLIEENKHEEKARFILENVFNVKI